MLRRFATPAALAGLLLLASCGDGGTAAQSGTSTPSTGSVLPDVSLLPPSSVAHPKISVPAAIPTTLVTTVIRPGSGVVSKAGDSIIVDYVGARSADGTEFDNSYDRGTPLAVSPLGEAQVIDGFNQGLIGVQAGEELQLDIPSSLAYGDQPQGEVIKAGDALSFVINVLGVFPETTRADEPEVTVQGAPPGTDIASEDLVVGTGPALVEGQTAVLQIIAFRSDTGARTFSTWEQGQPLIFDFGTDPLIPGLVQGVAGMNVGGRRELRVPFAQGFLEAGNQSVGIPAATDVVFVVDLLRAF